MATVRTYPRARRWVRQSYVPRSEERCSAFALHLVEEEFLRGNRESVDQKASTPSTMKPLNLPPLRMSFVGKSRYFWFTYSTFVRSSGVTNQPPPNSVRLTLMGFVMPARLPLTVLYRPP